MKSGNSGDDTGVYWGAVISTGFGPLRVLVKLAVVASSFHSSADNAPSNNAWVLASALSFASDLAFGFCTGGFCTGGFCTGGFCTGGFCTGGFCTDGSATDGSATDGSATDGSATDGSATDGSATDGFFSCFFSGFASDEELESEPEDDELESEDDDDSSVFASASETTIFGTKRAPTFSLRAAAAGAAGAGGAAIEEPIPVAFSDTLTPVSLMAPTPKRLIIL
jgi:hypothetical protein